MAQSSIVEAQAPASPLNARSTKAGIAVLLRACARDVYWITPLLLSDDDRLVKIEKPVENIHRQVACP